MRYITLMVLLGLSQGIVAQESLSFESALLKTLANNYDIKLSMIEEDLAANNALKSMNGYTPSVSATGSYNWNYNAGINKLSDREVELDPNSAYSYQAGVTANYMLFDGLGRKYRFDQAVSSRELSAIELKSIMEDAAIQLSAAYYEVLRLQDQSASLDTALQISSKRFRRARYAQEYGQSTGLDMLNAQVDLNSDSINLLNSLQLESNAKRQLNLIMGEAISAEFVLSDELELADMPSSDAVLTAALQDGTSMERAQRVVERSALAVKASKSDWYPELGLNAGYAYSGSNNPNGAFLIGNSSFGPSAGISLSWNLFDPSQKTRLANAKLANESSEIALNRVKAQTELNALNAHGAYINARYVLEASETTLQTAQHNFERSQELYTLGQLGSIEYRQAQLNLLSAELQLSRARYDAKNAELTLMALMGQLIK